VNSLWTTADLCDAYGEAVQVCDLQLRHFGNRSAFCGPASTVKVFEDNVLVRQRLSTPGEGRVLVVDGSGSERCALVGDTLAGMAIENGWAGIVVHGCVRDVTALAELDIGVLALGRSPRKCFTKGCGANDVLIEFGAVHFAPGAWVYCDFDGMLVAERQMH